MGDASPDDDSEPALPTVREQESQMATHSSPRHARMAFEGEALAMLVRRGFHPSLADIELPWDPARPDIERVVAQLERYAVRLFLRGAIARPEGFRPEEATRFVAGEMLSEVVSALSSLGVLTGDGDGLVRLVRPVPAFGPVLEWYVAHELRRCFRVDAQPAVKFHAPGVGGDLDVVASAEGRLIVLELKSAPPKHVDPEEAAAFVLRTRALRPDVAIFAMDTALRLADRVLPMLVAAATRPGAAPPAPRQVSPDVWALTPHAFLVNARPSLVANIGRALAEGLRALAPDAL